MPACPPPNPLWLQGLVTALPAMLIGLLAWFVSRGQLLVAKEKLRHDLFERRFAVFYAFQNYLVAVAMKRSTQELADEVVAKLATARFLFDQPTFEYLRTTWMDTANLNNRGPMLADPDAWPTASERVAAGIKHADAKMALFDKVDEIAAKLVPTLRLRDFGPRQA